MTNLIASLAWTLLVTNVETKYPTHQEPVPCPDGWMGCLVYHSKTVPDANPKTREVVTTVWEYKGVELPSLKVRLTNETRFICGFTAQQSLVSQWQSVTNVPMLHEPGWVDPASNITNVIWIQIANITNLVFTNSPPPTNSFLATNVFTRTTPTDWQPRMALLMTLEDYEELITNRSAFTPQRKREELEWIKEMRKRWEW